MASLEVAILAEKAQRGARKFTDAVRRVRKGGDDVAKGADKTQKSVDGMARAIKRAAAGLFTMAAAYKAVRFVAGGVKAFADFETSLAHISTMLDDQTMKFLPEYERQIAKLATTYGQATKALGKGTFDIISGSFKAADAMAFLETATKSAMGGFTDVNVSVKAMVAILNAYSMEAKEAGRVTDVMAAIVKTGVIEYEELAANIGVVVPIAAAAGLSLEELGAAISTITQKGVSARITMTALKAVVTTFLSPTPEAVMIADKYNLTLNARTLATEGITGAMAKLSKASAEETAAIFSNVRALLGVEATRKTLDILVKNHITNLNSLGMSERNFAKVINTTNVALAQNRELWLALKRDIGEGILPEVRAWLDGVKLLASDWNKTWDEMATKPSIVREEMDKNSLLGGYGRLIPAVWLADKAFFALNKRQLEVVESSLKTKAALAVVKDLLSKEAVAQSQLNKEQAASKAIGHWSTIEKEREALKGVLEVVIEESGAVKKARIERQNAFKLIALEASLVGKTNDERERAILLLEFEANAKDLGVEKSKALTAAYRKDLELLQDKKDLQKIDDKFSYAIEGDLRSVIRAPLTAIMEGSDIEDVFKDQLLRLGKTLNEFMYEELVVNPIMDAMKESIAPAMKEIGAMIMDGLRAIIQPAAALLSSFLQSMAGNLGGSIGGSLGGDSVGPTTSGAGAYGPTPSGGNIYRGAKGLVLNNASVTPFAAGGVLNGPTLFPMANGGLALGGEAGYEALMPLSRGADGKLGVENKSGASDEEKTTTIVNVIDDSMFDDYLSTGSGEKAVINLIRRNMSELNI